MKGGHNVFGVNLDGFIVTLSCFSDILHGYNFGIIAEFRILRLTFHSENNAYNWNATC